MDEPRAVCDRLEEMRNVRRPSEALWAELAEVARPLRSEFGRVQAGASQGGSRTRELLDGTGVQAAEALASALFTGSTNPAEEWLRIGLLDTDLERWGPAKRWLETAGLATFNSFGPNFSRFYTQMVQVDADTAIFGNGVMFQAESRGAQGFIDLARPLAECFYEIDAEEQIPVFYREYTLSASAAARQWGLDALPKKIAEDAKERPTQTHRFIHAVYANDALKPGAIGPAGKAFVSHYVAGDENATIARPNGFDEMPYGLSPWARASGETYARGPAEVALPEMQLLQAMEYSNMRVAQQASDPAMGGPDEGDFDVLRMAPGSYTPGIVDHQGRMLVKPIYEGKNLPVALEFTEQKRQAVREAFYASMLYFASGSAAKTATEWLGLNEEKLSRLAPYLINKQAILLPAYVQRRFNLLVRAGQIPPPPPELRGKRLQARFDSPFSRAAKAGRGNAVLRWYEGMGMIAQVTGDLGVFDRANVDQAGLVLADAWGVPASIVESDDMVAEKRRARAEQQRMQQMMAAAQPLAAAAQQGAQAVATLQGAGGQQGGGR